MLHRSVTKFLAIFQEKPISPTIVIKYKKDEAKSLVEYIMNLISKNPFIKNEFDKNKEYYITQFNYAN